MFRGLAEARSRLVFWLATHEDDPNAPRAEELMLRVVRELESVLDRVEGRPAPEPQAVVRHRRRRWRKAG
jgi:hypothetical protein